MATSTFILGKDASLKSAIETLTGKLFAPGLNNEKRSWLNPVDGIGSVHIRDHDCPLLFTKETQIYRNLGQPSVPASVRSRTLRSPISLPQHDRG